MATYDSIINVDEWISDHYFTTDETKGESFTKRVKNRTKEWAQLEEESHTPSPIKRFQAARGELQLVVTNSLDAAIYFFFVDPLVHPLDEHILVV